MMQDDDLDRLLVRAAARLPPDAPDLLDRVLADAWAEQKRRAMPARPAQMQGIRQGLAGRLGWLAAAFGGPQVLAGVCSAALAGVAIGYLEPGALDLLTGNTPDVTELFPPIDFLPTEG